MHFRAVEDTNSAVLFYLERINIFDNCKLKAYIMHLTALFMQ